jgi:hypothetical protein
LWKVTALRCRFARAWSALAMVTALVAVGGPVAWRPVLTALSIQFFLAGVIIDRLLAGDPADSRSRNPD